MSDRVRTPGRAAPVMTVSRHCAAGTSLLLCTAAALAGCRAPEPATCLAGGSDVAALRTHLAQEDKNGFDGAVAFVQGEQKLLWASDGYDPAATRFWIGSISKPVTATAAARLAQQDRLNLDQTVGQLFPFVSGPAAGLTLTQLLSHRSGLGDRYAAEGITGREAAVRAIVAKGVTRQGFAYSNDGYNLAAAMMEQATGQRFETLLQQQVFGPLGMRASGTWGERVDLQQFARYRHDDIDGVMQGGQPIRNYGYLGSTGIHSTAADMLVFLQGVRDDAFLAPEMRARMWRPGWPPSADGSPRSGTSYGLGWGLEVENDHPIVARHGGYETHLHNGEVSIRIQGGRTLVVLADDDLGRDRTWSDRILEGFQDCLKGA